MKRIMKIMPILIVLVLAFSIIGMSSASAEGTVMTNTQLYIGDYEVDTHSGEAHIVFGQVSDKSVEFGVIITDSENKSFLFKGLANRISESGKYGIAIYDLPDGDYTAQAYSGAEDSRVYGEVVPFTKGVDSYTVTFDVNGGEGSFVAQTVAQGGNATKPDGAPTAEDESLPFLGWTHANGVPFDFTAPVYENTTVYAQYELPGEIVEPVYNIGYTINGGGNYFGNANPADLTGGKKLVMEWDMLSENFAASNYNIGFFMLDSTALATKNNYPYSYGKSAVWWTNHAYYDYRHLWDGAQSKDAITSAGAVFHENLFHSYDIFHGVKHFKIVYTSYTATTGASIEIYTKDIGADDSTYKFWTSVTNIPSSAVPAENDVHLHFAVSGGIYNNTLFKLQITNFRYHVESGNTSTDVTSALGIGKGNGVVIENIYDVVRPTVSDDSGSANRGLALVGNKNGNAEGAATLVFNNYFTASDSLAFEVANGDKFEIALDYRCAQVSNSKILLREEDVNFKFYKVYFDGSYVTLAGRNSENAVWETVEKRGYQMDKFYIGIRSSSSETKANALFLDNLTYVNDGTTYAYTFNNGNMPKGFTVLADTSANVAYVPVDVFTVKYALYDGSVYETQQVGFGMNAVLPEGNWVNEDEAIEKSTFIDGNTMIMLVREGDNLGGNYVSVTSGAITNYGTWSENFAVFAKGANATVTADAHPDGYTFKGWQVNGEIVSTDATYTFAVNSNVKLIAKYNVPMHTVTVVNGTIDGIVDTTASIEDATKITVIANSISGKVFQGWSDGTEIVSNNKTYSFTVKAPVTLTATYIDAYTVNIDMSEVGGTDTKYIVDSEGHKVAKPDVSDVDVAPTNAELGFVTDDGKVWDFNTDVITRDITIYGKWVAVADLNKKAWKMQGSGGSDPNSALGNSVGVDLSDGSTLNMEFDVFDASIAQANYNQYFWIRTNTDYGAWSNYCFAYSNWACYSPWPYHGNIAGENSTISDNWCPDLVFAKDQSVKISYTAPTVDTNGSFIIYTKHIEGTEWNELCYVKDIPLSNVTDTKNVFMGIEIENASSWFKFMNFRMYVNDYEYNIPAIGLNGYLTETENTYVKPVTWQDGREYNIRVNTDAGVDAGGSFNMWFGNGVGVDLDEGESLTGEFTVDSVEYGLWYNCWGGIMVNSGAFPSVDPFTNTIANGVGWYSNFALNTGDYNGRTATVNGGSKGSAAFATGYNIFDPYTDVTGTWNNSIAPIMIKVVYTSYDKTNNVPGSIVYYKKLKSEGSWTKVTEVTGITAELYDSMHISLFYSSTQNAGGAWDFDISNFTYYTSGSKAIVPVIGVGGDGVCTGSLPSYTVKFMNGSSTVSTQKVQEGSLATAESLAGYTPALGGMYAWVDEDGNEFDFETSI